MFVIFLLSGLWHGANWTYVCWGLYHAILFAPLILLGKNKKYKLESGRSNVLPSLREVWMMCSTFILVVLGWIIFRANNMSQAYDIFSKMFSRSFFSTPHIWFLDYRIPTFIAIAMCFIFEWINRNRKHGLDIAWIKSRLLRISIYYLLLSMIILYSGKNVTFIYFQF